MHGIFYNFAFHYMVEEKDDTDKIYRIRHCSNHSI